MQHLPLHLFLERSSSERALYLVCTPVNFNFALVHILVDPLHSFSDSNILPLAFLEHLEYQVATDTRVIGVTKMLVDALLERFDAFASFLRVMRVQKLLEHRA